MTPLSVTEDVQSIFFRLFILAKFHLNVLYRQEILLATAAREPQPDYRCRRNHDLMLVIEDQWRKQLHEEQVQEEADRRMKEASRVESIVAKEGRRSRQRREGEVNDKEGGKQEGATGREGRRRSQDVAADRRMKEASRVESIVAKEGRQSRQGIEGEGSNMEGGKQEGTTDREGRRSLQDVVPDRRRAEIPERGDWKEVTTEESFVENAMEMKEKRRRTGKVTSSGKDVEIENGTKKPSDGT